MFIELDSEWTLAATPAVVTRVCLDFRLSLLIDSELGDAEIHCNGTFSILDPENDVETVVTATDDIPKLGRLRGALASIRITRGGELQIAWADRLVLVVPPGDAFEAWELAAGDLQLIGLPGGGVAVFGGSIDDAD